jgi:hypothetical protein
LHHVELDDKAAYYEREDPWGRPGEREREREKEP